MSTEEAFANIEKEAQYTEDLTKEIRGKLIAKHGSYVPGKDPRLDASLEEQTRQLVAEMLEKRKNT